MASRRTNLLLLIGLAVIAAVSAWRMISMDAERVRVTASNLQLKGTVQQLEAEHARLTQALSEARQTVDAQTGDLTGLRQELETAQVTLDRTVTELASLKRDFTDAQEQNDALEDQLSSVMLEKQQLETKLSDVKQLKLAIRDIRNKVWQQRWASWRARLQAHRHGDEDRLASGNQGYIIRDGVPTLGAAPQMHVHVLEPQAQ